MSLGKPPVFDGIETTWTTFKIRLEAYLEAQEIADETKRRAILISSLPDAAVRVIQGRCHPRQVNNLTYQEAIGYLQDYYAPEVNEIAASYAFFMRTQQPGETVQGFIAEIRRLAEQCNFGISLQRMLRDRIVCGVTDEDVRRHLLTRRNLTLSEAEDFVISAQNASENARNMHASEQGVVHYTRTPSREGRFQQRLQKCQRCGSDTHSEEACFHQQTICRKCGRRGHIARVCRSGIRGKPRGTYPMLADADDRSTDHETLYTLVAHQDSNRDMVSPVVKEIVWNGVPLRMIVDTGSPVSVVSTSVFRKHRHHWPPLTNTTLRLSCFLGELTIAGQVRNA